jgi:hypothetical protein
MEWQSCPEIEKSVLQEERSVFCSGRGTDAVRASTKTPSAADCLNLCLGILLGIAVYLFSIGWLTVLQTMAQSAFFVV